jgi:hypothetical protein
MEDDDVGIAGGIRCAGQRGDSPGGKALLGQLVGQEAATDRAILDEKGLQTEAGNAGAPGSKASTSCSKVAVI